MVKKRGGFSRCFLVDIRDSKQPYPTRVLMFLILLVACFQADFLVINLSGR